MVTVAARGNGKDVHRFECEHLELILKAFGYATEGVLSYKLTGKMLPVEEAFLDRIE